MTQTTTTQPTDTSGSPTCDWCDRPVTDDQMTDARGWTVHGTCFDAAHTDDEDEDFESFSCQCSDPTCS